MKAHPEALKEFGKSLLNFSVAILVFAFLQPVISDKVNFLKLIAFGIVYILIVVLGMFFISKGESNGDKQ